jgi:hypothetical protein
VKARHPSLQMLLATRQWRRNDGSLWARRLYGLLTLLIFAAPAVAALAWLPLRPAWAAIGGLALVGVAASWSTCFTGLLRLDHPHAAHTVPGHARAVRTAALGLWAALVALVGVVAAVGAALLDAGELASCWRFGLVVALAAGTLLFFLAAAQRWWWLWVLAGVSPAFLGVHGLRSLAFDAGSLGLQLWQAQPLGSTLLLLAVPGLLMGSLFGRGDAAHARAYSRRERLRRAAAENPAGPRGGLAAYGRWGEWLSLPGQAVADAWLRHGLARAQSHRRSVMARAEFVLHGHQHWAPQLALLLFVQACVGLSIWATATLTRLDPGVFLERGHLGIAIGVGVMSFGVVLNLPGALWASRREQALLVLLPGMPRGVALNRALARQQARHCLLLWAGLLPTIGLLLWAGHAPHALAFIGTALPLSAWLWRNHARMQPAGSASALVPLALCALLGLLSMYLLSRHPEALWPWLLGMLMLTTGLLAWRWRVLPQLPPALPVGRLA